MSFHEKQIEQELRDIKNALDESTIIAITDVDGVILYVNDKFCELSGYEREELIGQTHRIVNSGYHPKEFFGDLWKTIKSGKTWRGEIRNRAKDGSFYWLAATIVPSLDENGKPHRFIAVRHDITERREAEQLIFEKNKLLEQTYDAIFIWNIEDGIISWNQNAERLYGYTETEVLGKESHVLLKTVHSEFKPPFLNQLREKAFWEGELIHTTKSGEEVMVESRQHILKRDGDNIVVLETSRDITERKQLENKLARATQLSLVGELAAGLAHEIKNPLAGIKGVIDIILQRRPPDDNERDILESVRQEIERIDRTVHELLRQSRPKPLEIKRASLNETVRRAVQFASHQNSLFHSGGGKISTNLHLPESLILMPHDSASIEDAVLNLLLNARAAVSGLSKGEIFVQLSKAESKRGETRALIEVSDNGCGIPSEKLEQIFLPFFTTHEGGTGLGLAAVKRIARAHGGSCEVRSTLGKGSTFTIRLPYDDAL